MKYRGAIFDLGGTLADTLRSIAAIGNGTLGAFGLPEIEPEAYRQMVGNGADKLMERMLARVDADYQGEDFVRFRAEYDRRYAADPLGGVAPYPGLPELLTALKAAGIKLGVLSNKPDDMTRVIVHGLYGGLPDLVWGQLAERPKKPDPTAALAMAEALGLPPEDILYIGDSGVDMDTAQRAGMDSCGVLWGFRDAEELTAHGAKFLAKSAAELGEIIL